jgi:origin recognition complex subunit 2
MKRKRGGSQAPLTPSKRSRAEGRRNESTEDDIIAANGVETPSKRRTRDQDALVSSPKPTPKARLNGTMTNGEGDTPKSRKKISFATPTKPRERENESEERATPIVRNADRSARRKSAARLIQRTIAATGSDDEASDEEDTLARVILGEDEQDEEEEGTAEDNGETIIPETPSKRGRGRPKGSKNRRSPTPPLADLPPHEIFFWQNRPGGVKTSNNILPSHLLLNHDEYFAHQQSHVDTHGPEKNYLLSLHQSSFAQWDFELQNAFNICLYGFGSKRALIQSYAEHISEFDIKPRRIVIVNGYNTSTNLRDILTTIASTLFPKQAKLPLQPSALLQLVLEILTEKPPLSPVYILINSIDGPSLRKPIVQSTLATLAAHSSIRLVATADTPNFPLLWDITLRQQFHFVFHDCTTFASYDGAEIDVVESVNELLGRSGRRIGGRDGVGYVLKSLPENARNLYRILVAEHLAADFDAEDNGEDADEMDMMETRKDGSSDNGVEYRVLYHKAREELVCSTEHQFRGLLKEFYDHQMVESRRDALGTERLIVPFRREDMEGLLEDLVE